MLRRLPSVALATLLLAPAVRGQAQASRAIRPRTGVALELHGGYGSGGRHPDGLVGLGLSVTIGPDMDAGAFATAVLAQHGGETVFVGPQVRLLLHRGAWRPYLAGGAMLVWRDYAAERVGGFAAAGLEAKLDASHRWSVFAEGRALTDGDHWAQALGGLRAIFVIR